MALTQRLLPGFGLVDAEHGDMATLLPGAGVIHIALEEAPSPPEETGANTAVVVVINT